MEDIGWRSAWIRWLSVLSKRVVGVKLDLVPNAPRHCLAFSTLKTSRRGATQAARGHWRVIFIGPPAKNASRRLVEARFCPSQGHPTTLIRALAANPFWPAKAPHLRKQKAGLPGLRGLKWGVVKVLPLFCRRRRLHLRRQALRGLLERGLAPPILSTIGLLVKKADPDTDLAQPVLGPSRQRSRRRPQKPTASERPPFRHPRSSPRML